MTRRPEADELRRLLRDHAGLDFTTLVPADRGESQTVFRATDRVGAVSIIKILPGGGADAVNRLRKLETTVSRLRDRRYPVPRMHAIGQLPGLVYWAQERMSGDPLDPGPGAPDFKAVARFLPEVIRLNDAQVGLGTGDVREWPALIRRTLTSGGDGYCLHRTLDDNPGTRELLAAVRRAGDRFGADIPPGNDFVHYDFTPANLLSDSTVITGVIDVNPPLLAGERAFDLATMLFYCYDHHEFRSVLLPRLLELVTPGVACAYLGHIVLRQADWSLRHHPGSPATHRYLRLARLVVGDFARISGRALLNEDLTVSLLGSRTWL